jgi:hypothetical protein
MYKLQLLNKKIINQIIPKSPILRETFILHKTLKVDHSMSSRQLIFAVNYEDTLNIPNMKDKTSIQPY